MSSASVRRRLLTVGSHSRGDKAGLGQELGEDSGVTRARFCRTSGLRSRGATGEDSCGYGAW